MASKEPAAIIGIVGTVVAAALMLLKSFGVDITDDQQNAIRALVGALAPIVVGLIIRGFVWSPNSVQNAKDDAFVEGVKDGQETERAASQPPPTQYVIQ
jgi:uncharacterized membrane protein